MEQSHSVLLVDDEVILLELYKTKFVHEGFKVSTASSADDALSIIASGFAPDIILFDINMPEHSGFELLEKLRTIPALAHTLKIALTNEAQDGSLQRMRELGADDIVVKAQYTPGQIVAMMREALVQRSQSHVVT